VTKSATEVTAEDSFAQPLHLARGWRELAGAKIERLDIGMSGAAVFRVTDGGAPDRYLKIAQNKSAAALRGEIERMHWLAARGIRVPKVLRIDDRPEQIIMLTQAVPGLPADADADANAPPPMRLMDALAKGMAALHALPAADCPFDESVAARLSRAAEAIAAGEVDPRNLAERNRDTRPEVLLARLAAAPPVEDIVVVHGDATLSNILVDADGTIGFVDCGNAGRGDRYLDLSVLHADIDDRYGSEAAARFAQCYRPGPWDRRKAGYFSDLYELF
jgi:aminoglycoside phosphotransferase